jgi:glutaminase
VLARLMRRLARHGTALLLAHVAEHGEHAQRLRAFGVDCVAGRDLFDDADLAIEHAEHLLLAEHADHAALEAHSVAAEDNALLAGLDATQVSLVLAAMRPVTLPAGVTLFRQGDPADGVYIVLRGSISIVATAHEGARRQRFVSLSPGTLFGEMAMLDGRGRTADAVADLPSHLMLLGTDAFANLALQHPAIGTALYRNMARYLAERLRMASVAWTAAAA